MNASLSHKLRGKPSVVLGVALLATLATVIHAAGAAAQPRARPVTGHIEDHVVTEGCSSPVGLCTAGRVYGGVQGDLELTVTSLVPSSSPGVLLFMGTSSIATDHGTIFCSDSGAFNSSPTADGEGVHLCEITGGTGDLAGASGYLQETFNFQGARASGDYRGLLILP